MFLALFCASSGKRVLDAGVFCAGSIFISAALLSLKPLVDADSCDEGRLEAIDDGLMSRFTLVSIEIA